MKSAALILLACAAFSQPVDYRITADKFSSTKENGKTISIAAGSVRVSSTQFELWADRVAIFGDEKNPAREFYSEGGVIYVLRALELNGKELTKQKLEGDTIRCDRMLLIPAENKAVIYSLEYRGFDEKMKSPYVVRADEAIQNGNEVLLKKPVFTSCEFAEPDYYATTDQAIIVLPESAGGKLKIRTVTGEDARVFAERVRVRFYGVPLFYAPGVDFMAGEDLLFRGAKVGRNTRFGYYALLDWGFSMKKGAVDKILGDEDPTDNKRNFADARVSTDFRSARGYGFGLDSKYRSDWYRGYFTTYWLPHDEGPNDDIAFDRQFIPMESSRRWRGRTFNRIFASPNSTFELEYSYISDRNLLPEFFRREFQTEKPQESAAYYKYSEGNTFAYVLFRPRTNNFENYTESLPRIGVDVIPWQIAGPLHANFSAEGALLNQKFDDRLKRENIDIYRLLTQSEVFVPFSTGPFHYKPFAMLRTFSYDGETLSRVYSPRGAATAGTEMTTGIFKDFGTTSKPLGIDGLRHRVDFSASFADTFFESSEHTTDTIEAIDATGRFSEAAFYVKNSFQTRGADMTMFTFATLLFGIEYYPQFRRDSDPFEVDNSRYPFNSIKTTLVPGRAEEERHYSNLFWNAALTPKWFASFGIGGEFNVDENFEERTGVTTTVTISKLMTGTFYYAYSKNLAQVAGTRLDYTISETWRAQAESLYDLHETRFVRLDTKLIRDFHDFYLTLHFVRERTTGDFRVLLGIEPKLSSSGMKLRQTY